MKPIYLLFAIWQLVTASVVLGQTTEDSQKNAPQDTKSADAETIGSSLTADQLLSASQKAKQPVPPWKVSPAAESRPVFQYQFWPKESELKPGSGQLYYFRALTLLQQKNGALATLRQISNREDQATQDAREFVKSMELVIEAISTMAYLEDLSWDHRSRDIEGPRLYYFKLEDVQLARDLARLLMIKARIHLADRDFKRTSECVLIGNRLAYLMGQGESVIQRLVGSALQAMMRLIVEEMIQTPGCPNLYWAIATVPQPLITIRRSVELELDAVHRAFPALRQAATAGWSDAEAEQRWIEMMQQLHELSGSNSDAENRNPLLAVDYSDFVPPAQQRLKASGISDDQLQQMAPASIVMADTANELDRLIDDNRKALLIPGPQKSLLMQVNEAGIQTAVRFHKESGLDDTRPSAAGLFAAALFPSIRQLDAAADRSPTMFRRLMTLEAIRHHAAVHQGELPDSLDDLKTLPSVFAFSTEEPFEYRIEKNGDQATAVLSGKIPNYPAAEHLRFQIVP